MHLKLVVDAGLGQFCRSQLNIFERVGNRKTNSSIGIKTGITFEIKVEGLTAACLVAFGRTSQSVVAVQGIKTLEII